MISATAAAWALSGVERSLIRSPALLRLSEQLNVATRIEPAASASAAMASEVARASARRMRLLLWPDMRVAAREGSFESGHEDRVGRAPRVGDGIPRVAH